MRCTRAAITLALITLSGGRAAAQTPATLPDLIARIQRADFEADRPALHRLYAELQPYVGSAAIASRVQYWRAFALWRSALNGMNDSASAAEIDGDLAQAAADFRAAAGRDSLFADAKAGEAFCRISQSYRHMKDSLGRGFYLQSRALLDTALAMQPDNPRVLWLKGGFAFYQPVDKGGGPNVALGIYERALELARQQSRVVKNALAPSWGEAELLMSIAYTHSVMPAPNVAAANAYADSALAVAPGWHYVRDILMAQIRKAGTRD